MILESCPGVWSNNWPPCVNLIAMATNKLTHISITFWHSITVNKKISIQPSQYPRQYNNSIRRRLDSTSVRHFRQCKRNWSENEVHQIINTVICDETSGRNTNKMQERKKYIKTREKMESNVVFLPCLIVNIKTQGESKTAKENDT